MHLVESDIWSGGKCHKDDLIQSYLDNYIRNEKSQVGDFINILYIYASHNFLRKFFIMFCGCQGKLKRFYQKSFTEAFCVDIPGRELTFVFFMWSVYSLFHQNDETSNIYARAY